MNLQTLERDFFRTLNRYVEPAVRAGLLSPRYAPGTMIVLETTGFKTGATRRTPLLATRLGRYVFISTVRGNRSFWVKNLQKDASARYYLGGKAIEAEAFLVAPGVQNLRPGSLPSAIEKITDLLAGFTANGWAFAVLKAEAK
jgi:hypothetical protein